MWHESLCPGLPVRPASKHHPFATVYMWLLLRIYRRRAYLSEPEQRLPKLRLPRVRTQPVIFSFISLRVVLRQVSCLGTPQRVAVIHQCGVGAANYPFPNDFSQVARCGYTSSPEGSYENKKRILGVDCLRIGWNGGCARCDSERSCARAH